MLAGLSIAIPVVISQTKIDQARAVALVDIVAREVTLKPTSGGWVGLCPVHEERTPSFRVYEHRGNVYEHAHCFGCGFHASGTIGYLMATRGVDFVEAVRMLTGDEMKVPARQPPPPPTPDDAKIAAAVARMWSEAKDSAIARLYLRSRGLPYEPMPWPLRGHPAIRCSEAGEARPCVLAAVTTAYGEAPIAVQRIWTRTSYAPADEPDARPLDLTTRKKVLGAMGAGCVQLHPATDSLGLAEGVETALACYQAYRRPTWAALGASRYGHPVAQRERPDGSRYCVDERPPSVAIPKTVRDLVVYGDRDGSVGEENALWAAWWWQRQGLAARAVFPPAGVKDFAEMMQ